MPKTFELPVSTTDDTRYVVNPLNVTFLRSQQMRSAQHVDHQFDDDRMCPLQHPENADKPDRLDCGWSEVVEVTEVCFVNTVGPQSSITTPLPVREVRNLLDEALRYNL